MTFESDLLASGPAPVSASELRLFGRFVGRWRVRNALFSVPAGAWTRSDLEWSFAWVIGGRGIRRQHLVA